MEYPQLKKIYALIPQSLYDRLQKRKLFNSNFDKWLTNIIDEALKKEEME